MLRAAQKPEKRERRKAAARIAQAQARAKETPEVHERRLRRMRERMAERKAEEMARLQAEGYEAGSEEGQQGYEASEEEEREGEPAAKRPRVATEDEEVAEVISDYLKALKAAWRQWLVAVDVAATGHIAVTAAKPGSALAAVTGAASVLPTPVSALVGCVSFGADCLILEKLTKAQDIEFVLGREWCLTATEEAAKRAAASVEGKTALARLPKRSPQACSVPPNKSTPARALGTAHAENLFHSLLKLPKLPEGEAYKAWVEGWLRAELVKEGELRAGARGALYVRLQGAAGPVEIFRPPLYR